MTSASTTPAERDSVKMICARLQQANRALRLYPSDHPTAHGVLVEFVQDLTAYLDGVGALTLRVEENRLLFDGQEVYFHEEMRSNLAFLMFRDGLRTLTFHRGIDSTEIESFVDCLAHADDLASMEHDLATALWEQNLQHVEYEVVDPFLGGGGQELRDEAVNDLRNTVLKRLGELNAGTGGAGYGGTRNGTGLSGTGLSGTGTGGTGTGGGSQGGTGFGGYAGLGEVGGQSPGAIDPNAVIVTEADIQQGEREVGKLGDAIDDFAIVLLEIAGVTGPPDSQGALEEALASVVEHYLEAGNVDRVVLIVDRLRSLEEGGRRPPEFGFGVFKRAATSERLTRLMEVMERGEPEEGRRIEAMLMKMRDWILPGLLETLAESTDKGVRKTTLAVLEMQGGVPVQHLWPLMTDSRWYVVRNAVTLATGSEDPHLLDHLEPLIRHPDARVRREVIRSADTVAGQRPAGLFVRALNDDDSPVRVLAANGLGRHGTRANVPSLETQIEARDFAARPAEEINAFLSAYAALGGDATIEVLNKMWRRKVFGSRPLPLRLAAVQALAFVLSPAAKQALTEAGKSGEVQIRRAAHRALAEAGARMRGG